MSQDRNVEADLPPQLLLELLEAARAAVPMEQRYRDAAALAWSVTRLRQERQRVGFENASWNTYLAGLAKVAGIEPQPVLDWFGISSPQQRTAIRALCRLAIEIGVGFEELVAYVYRGFAEERKVLVPVRPRGSASDREYAERCAMIIEQLPWDPETCAQLKEIKREISREYGHK